MTDTKDVCWIGGALSCRKGNNRGSPGTGQDRGERDVWGELKGNHNKSPSGRGSKGHRIFRGQRRRHPRAEAREESGESEDHSTSNK